MARVLIVDDNPAHAALAAKIATKIGGVETEVYYDPFMAMNAALGNVPDLIITDMMMPKMDGITLIRELRKNDIYTPVIIITAYESKVTSKILPSNRIKAVLTKPFNVKKLMEAIEESVTTQD